MTKATTGIAAVCLLVTVAAAGAGDLFRGSPELFSLHTEFFEIIYPARSAQAATIIASVADASYRKIAALLRTEPKGVVPVVVTPDHESVNGYYTAWPYPRIVVYDSAPDPDGTIGSYRIPLVQLFEHELTHYVSLTIRSWPENLAAAVLGSPFGLSYYLTPMPFTEGVTVSLESIDGYGRAHDPLIGDAIRQDILEGRFKTFDQVAGGWDLYPWGNLYYWYGGWFSRYLQERYGMDAYAALWREFGALSVLSPLDDVAFIRGRFSKVFATKLDDAWSDFGRWMTPRVPIRIDPETLTAPGQYAALASSGHFLYWYDAAAGSVFRYDTSTRTTVRLFKTGYRVTRLDPSPDGTRMLVSAIAYDSDFSSLRVLLWDDASDSLSDLGTERWRDAVATWSLPFLTDIGQTAMEGSADRGTGIPGGTTVEPDGFPGKTGSPASAMSGFATGSVGTTTAMKPGFVPPMLAIRTRGTMTDLVRVSASVAGPAGIEPTVVTIIEGTEGYILSSPVIAPAAAARSADGDDSAGTPSGHPSRTGSTLWTAYVLVRENGKTGILRLGFDAWTLTDLSTLDIPPELQWIRYLSVDQEGILRFSWNDSSLYRLAMMDGETLKWQSIPISGGIHEAVGAAGSVYYLARFSDGIAPGRLAVDDDSFGYIEAAARWTSMAVPAPSPLPAAAGQHHTPLSSKLPGGTLEPFKPARWLLPRYWWPALELDTTTASLNRAGINLVSLDPAETFETTLSALWNFDAAAMDLDLSVTMRSTPVPLTLTISDAFHSSETVPLRRTSSITLGSSSTTNLENGGAFGWRAGAGIIGTVTGEAGSTPYQLWTGASSALEIAVRWADIHTTHNDTEQRSGMELAGLLRTDAGLNLSGAVPSLDAPSFGLEGTATAHLRPAAIRLAAWLAAAATANLGYGAGGRHYDGVQGPRSPSYPVWPAFAAYDDNLSGRWYTQAEASLRVAGLEIQRALGPLYFNRLSLRTGARAFVTASDSWLAVPADYGIAVYGSATLVLTPLVGIWATIHPSVSAEWWYRPDLSPGIVPYGLTLTTDFPL